MIDSERMTAELHRGLAGVCEERPALRLATVATMVRLAGEVCIDKTHTVVRVELRDPEAAFQLRRQISEISPRPVDSEIITTSGCSLRYLVRVTARGSDLARVLGLIDRRGVAVLGLPPSVIAGGPALAPGVWRGALLARGRIVGSQSLPRLHVTCPTAPVALALVGAARPFGVTAVAQDTAVGHRAVVNQPAAVDTLLRSIGVPSVADAVRQTVAAARPAPTRNPAFQSVNALRATAAAEATAARTRWALNVLGDQAPEHLQAIGRMRVEYPTLSLPELGRLSNPPLSKNAVSGRLRRLCRQAEESAGTSAREPSTPAV